jgi:hypothetical protein
MRFAYHSPERKTMAIHNKYLRKNILLSAVMIGALFAGGCGSNTMRYGVAMIKSEPPGAEVVNLRDDSNLGITPVKATFRSSDDQSEYVTVQLRRPGYADRITAFWINYRHEELVKAESEAIDVFVVMERENQP